MTRPLAIAILMAAGSAIIAATANMARSHEAPSGQWDYPSGCCFSAATNPNGDCAPISERFIKARPDGYHLDLPIGAHPKLKTKGYKGIVPYSQAKPSGDLEFHLCVALDGAYRYCFFVAPGSS